MPHKSFARLFCEKTGLEVAEDRLSALAKLGHEAWPNMAIGTETFLEHLALHVTSPAALDAIHASDLYLACGVLQHDRAALAYFEEHFVARVPEYVLRIRLAPEDIDEVKQKLREVLIMGLETGRESSPVAPKIAQYSGKGSLGGWFRVTVVRIALNHLRPSRTVPEDLGVEMSLADDPELAYVKEHACTLFTDAFTRVLAALDVEERSILRLHYIDGLTMDQLSRLYRTPRSTIARRVADVRRQILLATENLLRNEHRLSPSSIANLLQQARSQLEATITRLLR